MNDEDLCQWLRDNSAGDYRPSDDAAYRIEALLAENVLMQNLLEKVMKQKSHHSEEAENLLNALRY